MSSECSGCIASDRERALQHYVTQRMLVLVGLVEAEMRKIEGRLSGNDSGLADPFEEYASQLAGQHSFAFDAYEETASNICSGVIDTLTNFEVKILAAFSDQFLDFWRDHDFSEGTPWDDFDEHSALIAELGNQFQCHAIDWFESREVNEEDIG